MAHSTQTSELRRTRGQCIAELTRAERRDLDFLENPMEELEMFAVDGPWPSFIRDSARAPVRYLLVPIIYSSPPT